jgi:hypothetical protein
MRIDAAPPVSPGPGPRRLATDDRGAILVIGLLAAIFVAGLLYVAFGVGESIRHHERMNDAVDSGSYSTGVMHARAMNLVALANMAKLAVAAIQGAYLAITIGALLVIVWILAGGYPRWIKWGWMIAFLALVIAKAMGSYAGFKSAADDIVEASNDLQETIRDDLPTIALAHANAMVSSAYSPPATALVSAETMTSELKGTPIDEGGAMDICEKAFPFSLLMVLEARDDLPALKNRFLGYSIPMIMPMCLSLGIKPFEMTDSKLGGDAFQIPLAAFGEPLPAVGERGVQLATHLNDDDGSKAVAARRDVRSRISLAQSEYYFDGTQDENEMVWRMQWKARLRRFRVDPNANGTLQLLLSGALDEVLR